MDSDQTCTDGAFENIKINLLQYKQFSNSKTLIIHNPERANSWAPVVSSTSSLRSYEKIVTFKTFGSGDYIGLDIILLAATYGWIKTIHHYFPSFFRHI